MVARQGIARIIELVISILLLMSVFLIIIRKTDVKTVESNLDERARQTLDELANNQTLREIVLSTPYGTAPFNASVGKFIDSKLTDDIFFEIRTCAPNAVCGLSAYQGNVYSAERLISATPNLNTPVKIRLFLWREGN